MRAQYVLLACLALLAVAIEAASIKSSASNDLYRRVVCVSKPNGFRTLQPGSCSQYFECLAGVAVQKSCERFYDPNVQRCVNYNTGCTEEKQLSDSKPIAGTVVASEPCETTTSPCVETTTPPCAPETTTTTCAPPATPTTLTTKTTTTTTSKITTTKTTTTTTPKTTTTTCTTPTTTTPKTTTCTTPATTTCTTTTCAPPKPTPCSS
ncbi:integumentary mucin C.1-like isoform X2 [Drosophila navojoa]|uniref:integumentary mucin C.1-like isoform X2 n=1 Tax=Drosophila navojoa TaxID=7232 RepID=UPI0011BD84DC|nr:integumentary mucin C.1-like isoform X2 [Drosophila navojoa]